ALISHAPSARGSSPPRTRPFQIAGTTQAIRTALSRFAVWPDRCGFEATIEPMVVTLAFTSAHGYRRALDTERGRQIGPRGDSAHLERLDNQDREVHLRDVVPGVEPGNQGQAKSRALTLSGAERAGVSGRPDHRAWLAATSRMTQMGPGNPLKKWHLPYASLLPDTPVGGG